MHGVPSFVYRLSHLPDPDSIHLLLPIPCFALVTAHSLFIIGLQDFRVAVDLSRATVFV